MNLDKLKTGKEFLAYIFEEGKPESWTCVWREGCESFFKKDSTGHFEYIIDEDKFFKHTTIVMG